MDLKKALEKRTGSQLFYVTLDPERALGLEDVLPNYTIICPYKSELSAKLRQDGVKVVVLEELITQKGLAKLVQRGTYGILLFVHDRKIIAKNDYVIVLKNSQLIEDFCKRHGWKLLAPKAKIAEQFENKISQYRLLKNVVPYPHSIVGSLGKVVSETKQIPLNSPPVVLQFNRGHSGNSTFFIKSKSGLKKLSKKFPKREVKISEFIKGKTYTLNCLVFRSGEIITGSLSEQITGLKSATNNPNTTCGNDFTSPRRLSRKQIKKIQGIAKNTGMALDKKGYRGMFGIDVIIQQATGTTYFIEINTHQPASISFEARLHRKIGKIPLLAYFILDGLNLLSSSYGEEIGRGMPPIILPISAKQIIYRNKTSRILKGADIKKKHRVKVLISRMKHIKPNEEIYRIQKF